MLQKVKRFVLWYFTVAFVLSGVAVIANGVGGIAGLFWIAGGVLICPKVLPEKKTLHKIIAAIALFMIGVFFMPGENGAKQDDMATEIADVQQETVGTEESAVADGANNKQLDGNEKESQEDTTEQEQEQTTPPEQDAVSEPIGEYTVDELYAELNSNALRAEKTFQDQCILLSGVISGFDSDGKYISLGKINEGMFDLETVHCSFMDESQLMEALNYNKGDYITLKCVVTTIGEIVGYSVDIVEFTEVNIGTSDLDYPEEPLFDDEASIDLSDPDLYLGDWSDVSGTNCELAVYDSGWDNGVIYYVEIEQWIGVTQEIQWVFIGKYDMFQSGIAYTDGIRMDTYYDESGAFLRSGTTYFDGTGVIYVCNDVLYWIDYTEAAGAGMEFRRS